MATLLGQYFQRGQGTAQFLRPPPHAPFETNGTAGEPLAYFAEGRFADEHQPIFSEHIVGQNIDQSHPLTTGQALAAAAAAGNRAPALSTASIVEVRAPTVSNVAPMPSRIAVPPTVAAIAQRRVSVQDQSPKAVAAETQAVLASPILASPAAAIARRRRSAVSKTPAGNAMFSGSDMVVAPALPVVSSRERLMRDDMLAAEPSAEPNRPQSGNQSESRSSLEFTDSHVAPAAPILAPATLVSDTRRPDATVAIAVESQWPAAAAPAAIRSDAAINVGSRQRAVESQTRPSIEIRIGRIDVQVPPPAVQSIEQPVAVGMSLDAFLAETRQ